MASKWANTREHPASIDSNLNLCRLECRDLISLDNSSYAYQQLELRASMLSKSKKNFAQSSTAKGDDKPCNGDCTNADADNHQRQRSGTRHPAVRAADSEALVRLANGFCESPPSTLFLYVCHWLQLSFKFPPVSG